MQHRYCINANLRIKYCGGIVFVVVTGRGREHHRGILGGVMTRQKCAGIVRILLLVANMLPVVILSASPKTHVAGVRRAGSGAPTRTQKEATPESTLECT